MPPELRFTPASIWLIASGSVETPDPSHLSLKGPNRSSPSPIFLSIAPAVYNRIYPSSMVTDFQRDLPRSSQ
ncbi:hypothetical protein M408DRAFT_327752 [Serendipita vermifera MAFF 305830]|uniref:Uncharacterized protein n=1 Tax=Serendipita vermifera MAFF 305830 TaxID=933852 RepID=A0A0C2XP70_SERVB|nr:hypothetical protein M408DRAFT_327752 [Serendipita vermifera MAFF 305830]